MSTTTSSLPLGKKEQEELKRLQDERKSQRISDSDRTRLSELLKRSESGKEQGKEQQQSQSQSQQQTRPSQQQAQQPAKK